MSTLYRYEYRRNGTVIRTRWSDRETAQTRMEARIGQFHDCGKVAGDGDSNRDGSHPGCARNGGLLSVDVKADHKIVIFEEADGFHWNTQRSIDAMGAYDATGKGYPSRRKAMQAAKAYLAQNAAL